MKNFGDYDLLIIDNLNQAKVKRVTNNNVAGIIELFKENYLMDNINQLYFINIINLGIGEDMVKTKLNNCQKFNEITNEIEFVNIEDEGILPQYVKALEYYVINLVAAQQYEDAVEIKGTILELNILVQKDSKSHTQEEIDLMSDEKIKDLYEFLNLEGFDEVELSDIEYIADKVVDFFGFEDDGTSEIPRNVSLVLAQKYVDSIIPSTDND